MHLKYHLGNIYSTPGASGNCPVNSCLSVHVPICLPTVTSFPQNFIVGFFSKFCTMIPTKIWKKLGSIDFSEKF